MGEEELWQSLGVYWDYFVFYLFNLINLLFSKQKLKRINYFSLTDGEQVGFNNVTLLPTPFQIFCMLEYVCMYISSFFFYMFVINFKSLTCKSNKLLRKVTFALFCFSSLINARIHSYFILGLLLHSVLHLTHYIFILDLEGRKIMFIF